MQRLNKFLASAGVSSRRGADGLIRAGRVTVNGRVVEELGTRIDPEHDAVKVDGRRILERPGEPVYLMLHKPRGVITTMSDPEGRPTVRDLIKGPWPRVFPVGRLDFNSEGLLLLTDDGDLARALMHPTSEVTKTYAIKVRGRPEPAALRRIEAGLPLDGRRTAPATVREIRRAANAWLEISVTEGRTHLVRRLFEAIGHPVVKLRRIRYDGVTLGDLPRGEIRALTGAEIGRLRRAAGVGRGRGRDRRN